MTGIIKASFDESASATNNTPHDLHEIMSTKFKEIAVIKPGLLVEGFAVMAGKPKTSKSWFMLQTALEVAHGWNRSNKGGVLFLGLEDSARRIQDRVTILLNEMGKDLEPGVEFTFYGQDEWPRIHEGGLEQLDDYVKHAPRTKLICIDTWGRFAMGWNGAGKEYHHDLLNVGSMSALAQRHHCSIWASTHMVKSIPESGDWADSILGSVGTTATCDIIMGWRGDREDNMRKLDVTGKDIEESSTWYQGCENMAFFNLSKPPLNPNRHLDIFTKIKVSNEVSNRCPKWAEIAEECQYDIGSNSKGKRSRNAFNNGLRWLMQNNWVSKNDDGGYKIREL